MIKFSGTLKFLIFIVLLAAFIFAGTFFDIDPDRSRAFFDQYPIAISGFIFVVLYVVGTFFIWFGPKDVLRVASLFVFGVFLHMFQMISSPFLFLFPSPAKPFFPPTL